MRFRVALIAFLLLIVSVIVTLNFYFLRSYQSEMASQINNQQSIIAKTLSNSIDNTIEHFMEEIVSLSKLISVRGLQSEGLESFVTHAFEELNEDVQVDVLILDSDKGEVVFSSIEGYEIQPEDRELCSKCKTIDDGKYYISPMGANSGQLKAITPIRRDGVHLGAIMIIINTDDLNNKILAPLSASQSGNAWIMNGEGTLIYHPTMPEMVGRNIKNHDKECLTCHKSFNAEMEILNSPDIGSRSYVAPFGEDKLIAFSRMKEMNWIVCSSIPYSAVTSSLKNSMRLHSMLVLAIMFSTVFGAFMIIIINRARSKAEAKANYAEKVREYADELEGIVNERTDELRSEKEKLDALISSIDAGIGIFELNRDCVWYNHVLEGWMSPEVLKSVNLDTFYESDAYSDTVRNSVVRDKSVQEVVHLELGRKKGYYQLSLSPYHMPDGTFRILLLLQDITDLKTAEEQMIQSDKLAALSRLSAGVAHEIGNPLTSISSFVQILKGRDFDEFTSSALDTIYKHIGRIESILRKMSTFTRGVDEEFVKSHVKVLVDSTVELVKYDKRAKGVEINVDIPDDLPTVNVNANQLVQVIMNLMLNAADSMREGGTLNIIGRKQGYWLELEFSDTGEGISEENIKKIFDPFFTTKETGTGLGLPVCHSIISLFGGEIDVKSIVEEGTSFYVRLPIEEE